MFAFVMFGRFYAMLVVALLSLNNLVLCVRGNPSFVNIFLSYNIYVMPLFLIKIYLNT